MKIFSVGVFGTRSLTIFIVSLIIGGLSVFYFSSQQDVAITPVERKESGSITGKKYTLRTVDVTISDAQTIRENRLLRFADADLEGVDRVELLIDDSQAAVSYKHPFEVLLEVGNLPPGVHYMQLKGYASSGALIVQTDRMKVSIIHASAESDKNSFSTPSKSMRRPYVPGGSAAFSNNPTSKPPISEPGELLASTPTNLTVAALSSTSHHIVLTWSPGPGSVSASDYVIYRNGVLLNSSQITSYTDATTLPGYKYVYKVYARNHNNSLSTQPATSTITLAESTIWSMHDAPTNGTNEGTRVELGFRFMPKVSGYATGVRFYKSASSTEDTHEVSLWSHDGRLVANSNTYNETASGWQTAYFHTPIPVAANEMYTASYVTTTGNYVYTPGYFADQSSSSSFVDAYIEHGSDTPGVFKYSAHSAYPDDRFGTSNYWTDVLFKPANGEPVTPAVDHSNDANPSRCPAYPSFPDENCTGVMNGTTLHTCGGDIRVANTTYTDCFFPNGVNIYPTATNVKIINSRVNYGVLGHADNWYMTDLVMRDVEIDGLNIAGHGVSNLFGYTCIRCDIHSSSVPIQGGQFHVEDSYLHDIFGQGDSHNEAVLPFSSINNTLIHNTMIANWSDGTASGEGGMSAVVALYSHGDFWAGVGNVLLEKNYLATNDAHYCLYAGHSSDVLDGIPSSVRVVDNVFGQCSIYGQKQGAVIGWYRGNGNVWSNNKWSIDGTLIPEPGTGSYN